MRVLHLANNYLRNALYGLLFESLRKLGIDNSIFVPVKSSQPKVDKEKLYIYPCFHTIDRALFYTKQKKIFKGIVERYESERFCLLHAHTLFSAGYAAMKWKHRTGTPYIVAVRSTDKNTFFHYMPHLRAVGVRVMREADAVVFLSDAYMKAVINTYVPQEYRTEIETKARVIPNGISDVFLLDRARPHRLLAERTVRLIYVGEVSRNKNLDTTIAAAKKLIQEGWNICVQVVGEVKCRKYRKLIETTEWVSYHKKAPQEVVKQYLRQADLFVMPSHKETFGLVYAEAMSQGLPVLYTRGEGFDGHFPDGTVGYAVDDRSCDDVAEKIKLAMENYDVLATNAYENATKFSWDSIAENYQMLYQVIEEKKEKNKGEAHRLWERS